MTIRPPTIGYPVSEVTFNIGNLFRFRKSTNPVPFIRTDVVESNTNYRQFILFVVGDESNSRPARQNMDYLCNLIDGSVQCNGIDVLEDFQSALDHDILATPAWVQVYPPPAVTVLGNLNDMSRVLSVLGLKEQEKWLDD